MTVKPRVLLAIYLFTTLAMIASIYGHYRASTMLTELRHRYEAARLSYDSATRDMLVRCEAAHAHTGNP